MSKELQKRPNSGAASPSTTIQPQTPVAKPMTVSNQALQSQAGDDSFPISFDSQQWPTVPLRPGVKPVKVSATPDEVADRIATAVHSLFINLPELFRLLSNHTESFSKEVQAALTSRHQINLRTWIKRNLTGDDRIKAIALLHFPDWNIPATEMALALISDKVRDQEVHGILWRYDLATRQELERDYNRAFRDLGEGLRKDLFRAFVWETWVWQKAEVLLDRNLTDADEIYFDSVAIVDNHAEPVIKRLQAVAAKGMTHLHKLFQDWKALIKPGWAEKDLEGSMYDEFFMSLGGHYAIIEAIFKQYHAAMGEFEKTGTWAFEQESHFLANTALATAEAASRGGGTAEAPLIEAGRLLHQARTSLILEAERRDEPTDGLWAAWVKERDAFLESVREHEMSEGSNDYLQLRTIMMHDPRKKSAATGEGRLTEATGNLTLADQLYLAYTKSEHATLGPLIIKAWITGKIDTLRADLRRPRLQDGQEVRPSINLDLLAYPDYIALTVPDRTDELRGAYQLNVEFSKGRSDTQLRAVYTLLTTPGISTTLRDGVIAAYADQYLPKAEGWTILDRFLGFIQYRYEGAPTLFDFELLLKPPQTYDQRMDFIRRQKEAGPGVFGRATMEFVNSFTGNDQAKRVDEAVERMTYIERAQQEDPHGADWIAPKLGTQDPAAQSFTEEQAANKQMLQLRDQIVEVGATTVEIVVSAALSFVTAGTALAFLPGIVSTLAGMGIRELALGDAYEFFSEKNANKLLGDVASIAAGEIITRGFGTIVKPEFWEVLETGEAAAKKTAARYELLSGTIKSITTGALKHAADPVNSLTSEQMAWVLAKALTGKGLEQLGAPIKERFKTAGAAFTEHFQPNFVGNVINGTGAKLMEWAQKGTGGKSAWELSQELGGVIHSAVKDAITQTISALGKVENQARQKRKEEQEKADAEAWADAELARLAAEAEEADAEESDQPSTAKAAPSAAPPTPAPTGKSSAAARAPAPAPKAAAPTAAAQRSPTPATSAPAGKAASTPAVARLTPKARPVDLQAAANRRARYMDGPPPTLDRGERNRAQIKANNANSQKGTGSMVAANERYKNYRAEKEAAKLSAEERQWRYYQALMIKIEQVNVSTPRDKAVFYSGRKGLNRELAEAFAAQNGKITLEKTPGGKWLESLDLFGEDSPIRPDQAYMLWSRLSQRYALAASGVVVAFVEGASTQGVFAHTEYPVLSKENKQITNVMTNGH